MKLIDKIKAEQSAALLHLQSETSPEEKFLQEFEKFVLKQIQANPTKKEAWLDGELTEMKLRLLEKEGFKIKEITQVNSDNSVKLMWKISWD